MPQKVVNVSILLNRDRDEFNVKHKTGETIAEVLQSSQRKVERVKR